MSQLIFYLLHIGVGDCSL